MDLYNKIFMKSLTALSIAVLVIIVACVAGCTTSSPTKSVTTSATPVSTTPAATPMAVSTNQATTGTAGSTATTSGYVIDTTISVHYNDYNCINMPKTMGVDYLYPDEKFTIYVTSPGSGTITPNLLVLDVTDNSKLGTVKPAWDSVQKTWAYEGVVPIVKVIDIGSQKTATLKVKEQGHYFICIDDRKETGTTEAVYQVPVKVTRG
mgnify:CR=1 FL=1